MSVRKRPNFIGTIAAEELRQRLLAMTDDIGFITETSYSANSELDPTNRMSFVDRHMRYIETHPDLNIDHYMANLRLMTRKP